MSIETCKPCGTYKIMETTIVDKLLVNSNLTNSKNLDQKSYSFIWEYFTERLSTNLPSGNIHSRIHQSNWCQLYDRLSKFANLPFISKKTSLYQLYLITKPTDLIDPNYHKLKSLSIATLITILWTKLKEYLSDLNLTNKTNPSEETFISAVKDKSLDQIEKDVELLIDLTPTRSDWTKILNLYIFYQDETKLNLDQFTRDRKHSKNHKKYLYRQFLTLTYHWPAFLNESNPIMSNYSSRKIFNPFSENSMPDIFKVILTGDHLLPNIEADIYDLEFKKTANRRILAEAVLRRFVWLHLKTMFIPDHNLLVKTLKLKQLANIYQGKNLCDIITIPDNSPAWITYITNIGNILISRAANELFACSDEAKLSFKLQIPWELKPSIGLHSDSFSDKINFDDNILTKSYQVKDLERDFLRKWYDQDRDYALVALANSIREDGSVDICSLNIQIKARIKRGVLL